MSLTDMYFMKFILLMTKNFDRKMSFKRQM
jgi:hypothetical protein